jgi:serine/threonine-protein phosphatase PP1 catalytic subunit
MQVLADAVRKILAAQPTVVRVDAPCKVLGDIHGQFRDLLLLFSR